jgi:hypothetical protein
MKKNYFHRVLDYIKSIILFLIWLIVHPIMMLFASEWSSLEKCTLFRWGANYYEKIKRRHLVGKNSSRFSFTFSHGLLQFFILLILLLVGYWYYNNYINQSTVVKNNNLNIEVEMAPPAGLDAADLDSMKYQLICFIMGWNANDSAKMKKLDPSSEPLKHMDFTFVPIIDETDTIYHRIKIHGDFDLKFDTTEIRARRKGRKHIYNYEIERFGENDGKYYLVIKLMTLPFQANEAIPDSDRFFTIIANPDIFDKDAPPYLTYYINFNFNELINDWSIMKTDNFRLSFLFWDSWTIAKDKDSEKISNIPYPNVPYELLSALPEPTTNHPYALLYRKESFIKAVESGVYLKFVNRDLLNKNDRNVFFLTVLIGALASFILTILIGLFTKWRNLNIKSGNKDPYNDNEE